MLSDLTVTIHKEHATEDEPAATAEATFTNPTTTATAGGVGGGDTDQVGRR